MKMFIFFFLDEISALYHIKIITIKISRLGHKLQDPRVSNRVGTPSLSREIIQKYPSSQLRRIYLHLHEKIFSKIGKVSGNIIIK